MVSSSSLNVFEIDQELPFSQHHEYQMQSLTNVRSFSFHHLPPELQLLVLHHALIALGSILNPGIQHEDQAWLTPDEHEAVKSINPRIIFVNKYCYREGLDMLYGSENTYAFS